MIKGLHIDLAREQTRQQQVSRAAEVLDLETERRDFGK
jgi:hypothetical protein